jgi:hypothetical protein
MQGESSLIKKLGTPLVVLILLFAIAMLGAWRSDIVRFVPISGEDVVDLLTPLILIALFIERALEVFVTGWRSLRKDQLSTMVDVAKSSGVGLAEAESALDEYRQQAPPSPSLASVFSTTYGRPACTGTLAR